MVDFEAIYGPFKGKRVRIEAQATAGHGLGNNGVKLFFGTLIDYDAERELLYVKYLYNETVITIEAAKVQHIKLDDRHLGD